MPTTNKPRRPFSILWNGRSIDCGEARTDAEAIKFVLGRYKNDGNLAIKFPDSEPVAVPAPKS